MTETLWRKSQEAPLGRRGTVEEIPEAPNGVTRQLLSVLEDESVLPPRNRQPCRSQLRMSRVELFELRRSLWMQTRTAASEDTSKSVPRPKTSTAITDSFGTLPLRAHSTRVIEQLLQLVGTTKKIARADAFRMQVERVGFGHGAGSQTPWQALGRC